MRERWDGRWADLLLVNLSQLETAGHRLVEQVRRNNALAEMPIIAIQGRGRNGGGGGEDATSASRGVASASEPCSPRGNTRRRT